MLDGAALGSQLQQPPQRQLGSEPPLVLSLTEVGLRDIAQVGGKNASLGEMLQQLAPKGIRVPLGLPPPPMPTASSLPLAASRRSCGRSSRT
jgi:pyruvate,water dikinase